MNPSLQLALTFLVSIFFLCYVFFRKKSCYEGSKSQEAPVLPGAWPIIGHLHLLGGGDRLLWRTLGAMADQYGPAFNMWLGSQRAFVVSSWEVAKECFTTKDIQLASRPVTVAAKFMGYDNAIFGFAPHTPFWREMRKIATIDLLSNRRLEMFKPVRSSVLNIGLRNLYNLCAESRSQYVAVDINRWLEDFTLNLVVRMVAGKLYYGDSDGDEARRWQIAIKQFFYLTGVSVVLDVIPYLSWLDSLGLVKAMKKTGKEFDDILEVWLEKHRKQRVNGGVKAEDEQDFIDVMLSLQEDDQLSNFEFDSVTCIKSTCLALVLGGSETSSGTLTWAISLLLNNRQALKKAQEELDRNIGLTRQVEESDIKNLVYIQAIIKETLRLYPGGPLLGPREATEDCTISGYHVPVGTRVVINVWKIQRDPRIWEEPSSFRPERFLTSHALVDVRGQNFELVPFGSGRRSCPGTSLALQVLYLTLARLLHAFEFETPSNQPVDMTESPGLTLPKAIPLEILLTPRPPAQLYAAN